MKRYFGVAALLLCNIFIYAQYSLSGVVLDSATKEPLPNAGISVQSMYETTGNNGEFTFIQLPAGKYTIYANHVGCEQFSLNLDLHTDTFLVIYLGHHVHEFGEVTTHGHTKHRELDAKAFQRIDHVEILGRGADQLSDVFKQVEGVSFIKTGYNISKPMIRGLHSTRIAVITNFGKLEGQQWGAEHAPEIDPITSGTVELIKGAGSLIYAGDAPGGMFRIIPATFRDSSYQSIDLIQKTELISLRSGLIGAKWEKHNSTKGLANRLAFSVKKAGDAAAPDYDLANTAYQQLSLVHAIQYSTEKALWMLNTSFYGQDPGILSSSHIGNLSDLQTAFASDTPLISRPFSFKIDAPRQKIRHFSSALNMEFELKNKNRFSASFQSQFNHRREFDVHGGKDEAAIELKLYTQQMFLKHDLHLTDELKQQAGVTVEQQSNIYNGMYFIPNYYRWKAGGFYLLTLEKPDHLWEAGLRYDRQYLSTFRVVDKQIVNQRFNYQSWSGNISGWKRFGHDVKWHFDAGAFYKFPDINELFADGLHHASAMIEKGDDGLMPERTYSLATGFTYNHNRWKIVFEPYTRFIQDFIYLRPTGTSDLTIRGAFPVFEHTQTDAFFVGSDMNLRYLLSEKTFLRLKHMLLYVRDVQNSSYIFGMPPQRLDLDVERFFKLNSADQNTSVGLNAHYTFRQDWVETDLDFAPPPEGYFLLNLYMSSEIKKDWNVRVEANNLLNQRYRDYLNRYRYFADEIGINLKITIHYTINN